MNLTAAQITALGQSAIKTRDFVYFWPRDLVTGDAEEFGFWTGVGNTIVDVEDGDTRASTSRGFKGAGNLISVGAIVYRAGFVAQSIEMRLSGVSPAGIAMVRGYDMRRARVDIYRGIYEPGTATQIDRAPCRFTGFVDACNITVPVEGGEGGIALTLRQHTAELRRVSTETRSNASQRLRNPSDGFYEHAASVGEWDIVIGSKT